MTDIKSRWAFITGASRGIGRLSALFLADRGCNLILHARKAEHLNDIRREAQVRGVSVHCVSAELADCGQVLEMLKQIDALDVRVDIVMNSAGLQSDWHPDIFSTPYQEYDNRFRVNCTSPALICNHFLPKMIKIGFGRVLNTTSGIANQPELEPYSASKGALDKYTRDVASRLGGTGVTLNLVDPGWCRTDLGGPDAPNSAESTMPGYVLGIFAGDNINGRLIGAQDYTGMTLEQALAKLR